MWICFSLQRKKSSLAFQLLVCWGDLSARWEGFIFSPAVQMLFTPGCDLIECEPDQPQMWSVCHFLHPGKIFRWSSYLTLRGKRGFLKIQCDFLFEDTETEIQEEQQDDIRKVRLSVKLHNKQETVTNISSTKLNWSCKILLLTDIKVNHVSRMYMLYMWLFAKGLKNIQSHFIFRFVQIKFYNDSLLKPCSDRSLTTRRSMCRSATSWKPSPAFQAFL